MGQYIDGFVVPVSRNQLDKYEEAASAIANIWKEHGAIEYHEFVGDDMELEGTRSLVEMTGASEGEVVIFGWVVFESREARDLANQKVASDPRMAELVGPLVDPANPIFDARRMGYGGFKPLVGG